MSEIIKYPYTLCLGKPNTIKNHYANNGQQGLKEVNRDDKVLPKTSHSR